MGARRRSKGLLGRISLKSTAIMNLDRKGIHERLVVLVFRIVQNLYFARFHDVGSGSRLLCLVKFTARQGRNVHQIGIVFLLLFLLGLQLGHFLP